MNIKRFLLASLLALCVPVLAHAQGTPVSGCPTGGTVTITVTQATGNFFECDLPSGGTATTIQFAAPSSVAFVGSPIVIVKFLQGSTATTVSWASNIGSQTITATANVVTVVLFFYDPNSAHWYDVILKT